MRGGRVESTHRGSVAVVDEDGRTLTGVGEPDTAVYLRSAAKPFQAMPLLAAGGERAFRLGDDEIALMCASHGGEPRHVRVARRILERGGFGVADLACGALAPMHEASARALIARGRKPTALHNNCSGKHAGLLLACRILGFDPEGYWTPSHDLQSEVLGRLAEHARVDRRAIGIAVDGCSLPVFHLPLSALAAAYARLVSSASGPPGGTPAAVRARIVAAMTGSPFMVAGRGRFTTELLEAGRGALVGKEGAEGVYAIGLAARRRGEKAVGIAFKIEDGGTRARDAVSLDLLSRLGRLPAAMRRRLARFERPPLVNARGLTVGEIVAEVPIRDLGGDRR
jgi:L-asparaginase II